MTMENNRQVRVNIYATLVVIFRIAACNSDFDWIKRKGFTSIHQTGSVLLAMSVAMLLATLMSNWILGIYNAFKIKW